MRQRGRAVHLMNKLRMGLSQRGSRHSRPLHPLQHLDDSSLASADSDSLSAVLPAHDQICSDAASLSFNASMRYPHRHTNIFFGEGLCKMKEIKKKKNMLWENKCLQLRTQREFTWWLDASSADSFQETLIALLATQVALFVLTEMLQCILHILTAFVLQCCILQASL